MVSIGDRDLPQDLLIDILSCLPVKSILRCKCICKDWYSLIQSPNFINKHFHNRNNSKRPLVHRHVFKSNSGRSCMPKSILTYFPDDLHAQHLVHKVVDYPINSNFYDLIGPINGVFLVLFSPEDYANGNLALWNPATTAFNRLPRPKLNYQPSGLYWGGFNLGFGCEPSTNNYKVIWFRFPICNANAVALAVYTLKTNSWRQIRISAPGLVYSIRGIVLAEMGITKICGRRVGTLFNGAYYWLSLNSAHNNSLEIVLFDMEKEVFRVIPPPPSLDPDKYCFSKCTLDLMLNKDPDKHCFTDENLDLMLHKDSLALLVWKTYRGVMRSIDIWLMEREGFWTQHIVLKSYLQEVVRPLTFWGDEMSLIFRTIDQNLLLYNLNSTTNNGREVILIENFESDAYLFKVFNYKESIVPIISEGCTSTEGCSSSRTFSFIEYIAQKLAKICQLSSV